MKIGQQIKEKRQRERLSAEDLAQKLGLKKENIYKWERGSTPSDPTDYNKIVNWLNNSENVPQGTLNNTGHQNVDNSNIDYREKYMQLLENDRERFLSIIELSLTELLKISRVLHADVKAGLRWEARKAANGNAKKELQVIAELSNLAAEFQPELQQMGKTVPEGK